MPLPLPPCALHEIYAARESDGAALRGAGLGLIRQALGPRPVLWVRQGMAGREMGEAYAPGLAEYGLDPRAFILVRAGDVTAALQAGLEGARSHGLGAVFIELWGEAKAYGLTASRRLALAARTSGVTVLMARTGAQPLASAADTRWRVRAIPSRTPSGHALSRRELGPPAFEMTLLRTRNGQEGARYHLEWNRNERRFEHRDGSAGETVPTIAPAIAADRAGNPPLSGAVVPVSFDRTDEWTRDIRQTGDIRQAG